MHWAAHKHTAAEVIYQRADADYDSFNESDWYRYQIKRLQETVDFIEKTLLEYIEPK